MDLQLLSTFQQFAAIEEPDSPEEGVRVIRREIQWQLAYAMINLMEYHGIESGLKLIFQKETLCAPTVAIDIIRNSEDLFETEKAALYKKATFFLEELQSFDQTKTVAVTYYDARRPARIIYAPKFLHAALSDMREHKFPEELFAIRHLNMGAHLLERAENYIPAAKLS